MKELSDQTRAIIAAGLCLIVIIGWSDFFKPPKPPVSSAPETTQVAPQVPGAQPRTQARTRGRTRARMEVRPARPAISAATASGVPAGPVTMAPAEKTIVVESDLYRVALSNRGAVVRSWLLKKYTDEGNPPHTLDVVSADLAQQSGGWPLSLQLNDPQLESAANQALYVVSTPTGTFTPEGVLTAPAEIDFQWSDGRLAVTKRLKFDKNYVTSVEVSVQLNNVPLAQSVAWRGGFGDATVVSRRGSLPVQVFFGQDGKMDTLAATKLGQPKQPNTRLTQPGPYEAVGIEDLYFAAAFLPPVARPGQPPAPGLSLTDWAPQLDARQPDGKVQKTFIAEMAAGSPTPGPLNFRLFVGPKDIDLLKSLQPPLNSLVQFGWFTVLAEPLFYALRWMHNYIPNYGWCIVLLALGLNAALFPLKAMSMRAAQKMQRVGPEIKAIQERYKKYSMRDPRKAEMNKEVMAVYSREGINPLGSCWPQLIQFPIWFAVYRMLEYAIELRHAPWGFWIHDLASPDPYYILPTMLAATGYVQTKMTPQPGVDPAQARMMSIMPLAFGFFFIFYPSGLSLYILGSYAIGIAQQWYLNRTSPLKGPSGTRGPKRK